jgi:quercetin dioxygenase-like cupin family protein
MNAGAQGNTQSSRGLGEEVRLLELERDAAHLSQRTALAGSTAQTLTKLAGLKLVLIALRAGARIPQHRADVDICIQLLRGRCSVEVGGQALELTAGQAATLARGLPHDVSAQEDSELLLILGGA